MQLPDLRKNIIIELIMLAEYREVDQSYPGVSTTNIAAINTIPSI